MKHADPVVAWVVGVTLSLAIFLSGWGLGARYTHPAIELQKAIAPERKDHQLEFFAPGFAGDCLAFYVDGTPIMRADAISKAKEHPITLKCYVEE